MLLADQYQYSNGVASGASGSHAASRADQSSRSDNAFRNLLSHGLSDVSASQGVGVGDATSDEEADAESSNSPRPRASIHSARVLAGRNKKPERSEVADSVPVAQSTDQPTTARWLKSLTVSESSNATGCDGCSSLSNSQSYLPVGSIPTGTQTTSPQPTGKEDTAAAPASQASLVRDLSTGQRWLLGLAGNGVAINPAGAAFDCPTPPPQPRAVGSADQIQTQNLGLAWLGGQSLNQAGGADIVSDNAVRRPLDIAPFAQLSLTPSVGQPRPSVGRLVSSTTVVLPDDTEGPRFDGETARGSEANASKHAPSNGNESAPGESDGKQKTAFTESRRPKGIGAPQILDVRGGRESTGAEQNTLAMPFATRQFSAQLTARPEVTASTTPPLLQQVVAELGRHSGSSVESIELQVQIAGESPVGLKFIEKQGCVEIQLKSSDARTSQELADNLADLGSALNDKGWTVDSRIQGRNSILNPGAQDGSAAERGSSLLAGMASSGLVSRTPLNSSTVAGDLPVRDATDHFGTGRPQQVEQFPVGPSSRRSGSESSVGQDHSRPDRDSSSDRNGQDARSDNAGANSERKGRRSARDSKEWMESLERNLT